MSEMEDEILARRFAAMKVIDQKRSIKRMALPNVHLVIEFEKLMLGILRRPMNIRPNKINQGRMISFFGTPPIVFAKAWELLMEFGQFPNGYKKKHLLWAGHLMKVYSSEKAACTALGSPDEKTYRKWSWCFIFELEALTPEVVSYPLLLVVTSCRLSK
jgi:hypothetical protein